MRRTKPIACALIAAALCMRLPAVFAEEIIEETEIEMEFLEEAPAAEEEIYLEEVLFPEDEPFEPEPEPQPETEPAPEGEPAPEAKNGSLFTLHTPEDMSITFGVETRSVGFASVSDVADMPEGARIMLYIDGPAFVNVDDADETIPLSITDAEGNNVICLWDEFTGERTVELFIHVGAEDWARVALGGYVATINYRAAVE
jgi:hypothetical protein